MARSGGGRNSAEGAVAEPTRARHRAQGGGGAGSGWGTLPQLATPLGPASSQSYGVSNGFSRTKIGLVRTCYDATVRPRRTVTKRQQHRPNSPQTARAVAVRPNRSYPTSPFISASSSEIVQRSFFSMPSVIVQFWNSLIDPPCTKNIFPVAGQPAVHR